jgi:hypothetical protein
MLRHWREARARAKEQGWGPVMSLIKRALRTRITNPWFLMYWIPTSEIRLVPLPANASFVVLTDPKRELTVTQQKALTEALGPGSITQAEARLARGARLNVLFVDDMVAGTVFTVSGAAQRFQHMVLTDADSMGFDGRMIPAFRGRGLFPVLLTQMIHALHAQRQERFYADVLATNTATIHTFEKIGLRYLTRYRLSRRGRYRFVEKPL